MSATIPARKAVKTTQLPGNVTSHEVDGTQQSQNSEPASLYTVAMTAINFVTFLFSLLAVDIHYTLRRSTMSERAASSGIVPKWLHHILRPSEPYGTYYRTKQKKLMRMEAEDAFRLRNRTLVVMAGSLIGAVVGAWWLVGRIYQRWVYIAS
ncbi:hypothetical protein LIA77_02811 [Sarocladium implicatum]|nr:hypothetical protein LIA77_02811 [Sarocladium implicatum]